jgi:DnaK suppressor protein
MESSEANELLASERARIERALSDAIAAAGDEQGESLDSGEGASDLIETEIDESLAASLREQLAALERAERRLAEGRYGISVQSGEPIPDARLRSIPWAERTAAEQARYESGG